MTQPPYGQDPQDPSQQNPEYRPQPGGYTPAPGAPAGQGARLDRRPGQVTAAAVLGFIAGAFSILGALGLLLTSGVADDIGVSGALVTVFGLLYVAFAVGYIYGGLQAMSGKNQKILLITAAAAIALQVLYWIIVQFAALSLIGLILPIVIIAMLVSPQSKQWFAAKGGSTF
ncbi:hypothetical protein BH20ACT5_BH20ACT5_08360 [soil metagenome]